MLCKYVFALCVLGAALLSTDGDVVIETSHTLSILVDTCCAGEGAHVSASMATSMNRCGHWVPRNFISLKVARFAFVIALLRAILKSVFSCPSGSTDVEDLINFVTRWTKTAPHGNMSSKRQWHSIVCASFFWQIWTGPWQRSNLKIWRIATIVFSFRGVLRGVHEHTFRRSTSSTELFRDNVGLARSKVDEAEQVVDGSFMLAR